MRFKETVAFILISTFCIPAVFAFQDDDTALRWYQKRAEEVSDQLSFDAALKEAERHLHKAIQSDNLTHQLRAIKEKGLIYLIHAHDYDKALGHFIEALRLEDSLNIAREQMFTYLAIAKVFEEVGDNLQARHFLEQAREINQRFNDMATAAFILNKLGKIHAALGELGEALGIYNTILQYAGNLDDRSIEAEAFFNKAHLYTLQGKYEDALNIHKNALKIRRQLKDRKNEARLLSDIGELYGLMRNGERASANFEAALEIRQALKDKAGLSESYNNLGVWYYQEGKLDEAVRYLEQGLAAGRESQMQNQIRRSAEFLSLCYQQRGELSQALEYKDLYIGIQDFIQRDKDEHTLVDAQNRYTLNRKQLQIEKLETDRAQRDKEIQAQKKVRNFLVAVVVLGAVVALLIFYLYVQKQRSNKRLQAANERVQQQNVQLQELNATKDKFFSIISHDLKGPLNSLTSFSGLLINHTDSLSKDEIKMLAKDLDKSLKNLFALLENLLEWSRSQTGNIEFNPESFDLTALLQQNKELLTAQAQNKNIGIQVNTSTPYYVNAHKHSVNTVIRNLLSNAIKFTPAGGTITLEAKENKGQLLVSVKDTGVGMPKEVLQKLFRIDTKHSTKGTADEKGTGLGLILCKEFIEKNGGTIWVESEVGKGSEFLFTLPYITVGVSGQRVTV